MQLIFFSKTTHIKVPLSFAQFIFIFVFFQFMLTQPQVRWTFNIFEIYVCCHWVFITTRFKPFDDFYCGCDIEYTQIFSRFSGLPLAFLVSLVSGITTGRIDVKPKLTVYHNEKSNSRLQCQYSPKLVSVKHNTQIYEVQQKWGRGNSTVVSISVYQAGNPGSRPPRSTCYRKVELYHCVIDLLPPVPTTGRPCVIMSV